LGGRGGIRNRMLVATFVYEKKKSPHYEMYHAVHV
jgi:hypothetical protein